MDYITELYCLVDDFWQSVKEQIDNYMISDDKKHRNRQSILSLSEMTTLVILFHSMRFRHFKKFYQYVSIFMRREFPRLLSYNRFIELMPRCIVLLTVLFDSLKGSCSGVSVVDSTPLAVSLIFVSVVIKCLMDTPNGVKAPQAGSSDSNYT